jgi:hypothetical protein
METPATMLRGFIGDAPNGAHSGFWSGYHVAFSVDGFWYELHTRDGVRGVRVPCTVTVDDGRITVSA